MRRGADTNRTGSKGLARRGGTRKLRAKVCCTPPSNGAQTEIEWTATRVDAAFHMDRHRGSTPLGSIYTLACARWASFTLACARWASFTGAGFTLACARCLGSRSLVSRAPSRPDSDFTLACARCLVLRAPSRPDLGSRSRSFQMVDHEFRKRKHATEQIQQFLCRRKPDELENNY